MIPIEFAVIQRGAIVDVSRPGLRLHGLMQKLPVVTNNVYVQLSPRATPNGINHRQRTTSGDRPLQQIAFRRSNIGNINNGLHAISTRHNIISDTAELVREIHRQNIGTVAGVDI
jgi:hypothetical protein